MIEDIGTKDDEVGDSVDEMLIVLDWGLDVNMGDWDVGETSDVG